MLLEPQYAQNIIVAVTFRGEWQWYITDKELWFLDLNKLTKAFLDKGYDVNSEEDDSERFGIRVLSELTADIFLAHIHEYRVEVNDLKEKVLEACSGTDNYDCILDICPVLYVDFDKKGLISLYPEPVSYEDYLPDGWIGKYEDFTIKIPEEQKYWVINGKDYFKEYSNAK